MSGAVTIRVIDFETTDLEQPAQVIEDGSCDLTQADGGWSVQAPTARLCGVSMPISAGARSAHHITQAEVTGLALFDPADLWASATRDGVTVIAAHNLEFDSGFWGDEQLPVICTLKAALRVWPDAPSHKNGVLRYWLEDQGLIALTPELTMPAHRAGPDAYVTAHILKALLATGATGKEMVAWTREPRLLPKCPNGKWRGKPWAEVDAGYLRWMLGVPDMEADFKWNAQRELDRRAA